MVLLARSFNGSPRKWYEKTDKSKRKNRIDPGVCDLIPCQASIGIGMSNCLHTVETSVQLYASAWEAARRVLFDTFVERASVLILEEEVGDTRYDNNVFLRMDVDGQLVGQ